MASFSVDTGVSINTASAVDAIRSHPTSGL